jgi:hypothetical protein
MNRLMIAASTLVLLASPVLALELTQVPPHVLEVAKHYAPDAQWESAGTDFDTQTMWPEYEIAGKLPNGTAIEVDVTPEGNLHEVETVIEAAAVPEPVMKLIGVYLPGFTPTLIESSARPDNVTFYEFEGTVNGREVDVEVNAAGTEIIIADDSAI